MNRFLLSLLVLITVLSGCRIVKPETSYIKRDSTIINYVTVDVPVKGAAVSTGLNLDSLVKSAYLRRIQYTQDSIAAVVAGKILPPAPAKIQTLTDPQTKAQLTYWVDQYGRLQIICESKDQVVKMLSAEVTRLSQEVTKKTEILNETPKWNWIVMGALVALLLVSAIFNLLLIKKR